jgi:uncharacterized Zn finger protein (UPF0148 family)
LVQWSGGTFCPRSGPRRRGKRLPKKKPKRQNKKKKRKKKEEEEKKKKEENENQKNERARNDREQQSARHRRKREQKKKTGTAKERLLDARGPRSLRRPVPRGAGEKKIVERGLRGVYVSMLVVTFLCFL